MEQTIEYKGYTIEIEQDVYAENPNSMGDDSLHFLVYEHSQFHVDNGDTTARKVFECLNEGNKTFMHKPHWRDTEIEYHVFPVYAYIHSGVALSLGRDSYPFNDRWDVSTTGFLLIAKEQWPEEDEAFKCGEAVIEEWNHYLCGNTWCVKITDKDDEEVDSCGGFTCDIDYVIDDAKSNVEYYLKMDRKQHYNKLKQWVKSRVPLNYRFANNYL